MSQFNYIFRFPNQMAANIDPIVGPFLAGNNTINPLTVYQTLTDSVNYFKDYWCLVVAPNGTAALLNHPLLQFLIERTGILPYGGTVWVNNLQPPTLLETLVISTYWAWPYLMPGLRQNYYVTEDGMQAYGTEDNSDFYGYV